jgi:DHA1 family tetracycline resistance protein-like MFS transporter
LVLLPLIAIRFPKGQPLPNATTGKSLGKNLLSISATVIKNKIVLRLAIVYALKGMAARALIGFVPLYADQKLGMTTALIGLGLTLYFGAGIGAKALMGYLYNRWGARMALFIPLLASGVFAVGVGLSPISALLLIFLVASGITGPISPIILTAAADFADGETLASAVGFIYTCYGLGFLSPVIGGWLAEGFGLSMPFFLSAVLIWSAAVVALKLPGKSPGPS